MKEEFLYHAWNTRLFFPRLLRTTRGENLEIISTGEINSNAGPDFINARIRIGKTVWAGNVEIHIRSGDFMKHGHQDDKNYDNLILHVVYENDTEILRRNGEPVPCLELKGLIDPGYEERYESILKSKSPIPCSSLFSMCNEIIKRQMLERCGVERLEDKTRAVFSLLDTNQYNWESAYYYILAKSFGTKINADPFLLLAKSLPLGVLAKHKNSLMQLEALVFGTAGFLENEMEDKYPLILKKEFQFLKSKYSLQPLSVSLWKFLRLRPANFPTLRLAQFASLIHRSSHLFSKTLEAGSVEELMSFFKTNVSDYWNSHYQFGKITVINKKNSGDSLIHSLIINAAVPVVFAYGKWRSSDIFKDKSMEWLRKLPAENNRLIRQWKETGLIAKDGYDSQALIRLNDRYCSQLQCLNCAIGHHLICKK